MTAAEKTLFGIVVSILTIALAIGTSVATNAYANGRRDQRIDEHDREIRTLQDKMDKVLEVSTETNVLMRQHLTAGKGGP